MPNRTHNRVSDAAEACPPVALKRRDALPPEAGSSADPPHPNREPGSEGAGITAFAPRWFALRLRSNREFQVRDALAARGIEVFLPTWSEDVKWTDRWKTTTRPLFPGYVFARLSRSIDFYAALLIRGVVQFLPSSHNPWPIDEREINAVLGVVAAQARAAPCEYQAGERVTIASGPLAGVQGVVVRTRGATHVVLTVEMLRRSIRVELDADTLTRPQEAA